MRQFFEIVTQDSTPSSRENGSLQIPLMEVYYSELDPVPGWPPKIRDQFLMCRR